eukprot:CAMPEP_0197036466 /NCGR_PEP_ID=MMETSP1384-20130603/13965_1 /TAXON_ID=29189 /ORGANISM="Ammonia sp." /LENGTH=400 /DNA_ID=CAMNT_0042466647 /DNA_START=35 /DNA_END=1237 /DNA_ORIENTATION=+
MAPPVFQMDSKVRRFVKLIALLYFLWQLRKLIRKLRSLSNAKHSTTPDLLMKPSARLFPQFFESANKNGLWIFHRDWVIPTYFQQKLHLSKPKGIVIISHGLAEHVQRYEHLAQQLNAKGFNVYGIDHQGHGCSDGDRSYVENFQHYVNDLLYFSQGVAEEWDEFQIPIFLFGHSMGGLIATYTALKSQKEAKHNKDSKFIFDGGVILSSPFFGVAPEADIGSKYQIVEKSLRFLSNTVPKLRCIALDNRGLSHDPKVLYRLQRDPLHHTDMICIRTIQEIVDAASSMMTECRNVEYPYLLLGGHSDPLCNPSKWKVFHDNTLSDDKELIMFEGLYHECLNETEPHQKQVCIKIVEWLEQRCQIYEHEKRQLITRPYADSTILNVMHDNDMEEQTHPFAD